MKHIVRVISHWGLLLHIYISMSGFTLVLLFAVTGFTLNHRDFGWGDPRESTSTIPVPAELADHPDSATIDKYLKTTLGLTSRITSYHEDDDQIQATFAVPGRRTVVTIDRKERTGEAEKQTRGVLGKIDDLHKGFDSGRAWYWVIDITAILLTISSITGMVTIFSLRARRRSGLIVAVLGIAMVGIIYVFCVPG